MKHTISFTAMIAICSLFSLAGCGNSQQGSKENRENNPSSLSDINTNDDTESETDSFDRQEQEEAELNNNSDAQEIVYEVRDEIKNADFSSGLVQIGNDIFRNGGYVTVDQFLQEYGEKYNVTEYSAGRDMTVDPDGYMRNIMTKYFSVTSKEDPSLSFFIDCDPKNVATDEEKVRIGDCAIVSFRDAQSNKCWYPHGICGNAKGFTVSDIPDYLTGLGYKEVKAEESTTLTGVFFELISIMDTASISFREMGTEANLFGETPVYRYSFDYMLNKSTPNSFEVETLWRSGCDFFVDDLSVYHPVS